MKINLVTPAGKQSRSGNRTTALRWARILRNLGHRVAINSSDDDKSTDMMVAVHAWRSAHSIRTFSDRFPEKPLIVLLAGTDIYEFQYTNREETIDAMTRASALVGLHELVYRAIPRPLTHKLHVIYQSSLPLPFPNKPSRRWLDVCVVGHLRKVKDPLRAATAANLLPGDSRIRIIHLGKALNKSWEARAVEETKNNPRYIWRGEVTRWEVRRQYARSHAMIISSMLEGGANVISEAIVCKVPVIASHIDGNVGLLGSNYEGYYPLKDASALSVVLNRLEREPTFRELLSAQCAKRAELFTPKNETASWKRLITTIAD